MGRCLRLWAGFGPKNVQGSWVRDNVLSINSMSTESSSRSHVSGLTNVSNTSGIRHHPPSRRSSITWSGRSQSNNNRSMYGSQGSKSSHSASQPSSIESGISAQSAKKRRMRRVRRTRRRIRKSPETAGKSRSLSNIALLTSLMAKSKITKKPVKKNITTAQLSNLLSMISIKKK